MTTFDPDCLAFHLGQLYAIEPMYLRRAVSGINADAWPTLTAADREAEARRPYSLERGGIAVIEMNGPMVKGSSKFPHANTLRVRRAVREASVDPSARAILLLVDSPGGMVAGTQELADDVARANKTKPVYAHADDLMASAAYWVASQAARITANRSAEVGSIGTVAVVADESSRLERLGVTVHVVSTGAYKGAFSSGAAVPDEHLAYLRERVESLNGHFVAAVRRGRGMDAARLAPAQDGRVYSATAAKSMGLVDQVTSADNAIALIRRDLAGAQRERDGKGARAMSRIRRAINLDGPGATE